MSENDPNFQTLTSSHITFLTVNHNSFRKLLLDYGLSMQEVFREFVSRAIEGDPSAISMLKQIKLDKRNKVAVRKVPKAAENSIFSMIEEQNPLRKK